MSMGYNNDDYYNEDGKAIFAMRNHPVWAVLVDWDCTTHSAVQLQKLFTTEQAAKLYISSLEAQFSHPVHYQIRKMRIE